MAGAVASGKLSSAAVGTRFSVATPRDDAALRRLLRESWMPGAVSLTFEREPDYFWGEGLGGAQDETIVAFADDQLVCMGRCSQRDGWVDGQPARIGYLGELRLDLAVRGRFGIVRDGYRFFHERQLERPADLYFTSIAADNRRARRFLERGVRGMPEYQFLAELVTLLVAVPLRPHASQLQLATATPDDLPEMLRVLNGYARRHQLATVWTMEILRALAGQGLPLERFLLAREGNSVIACGALWDQRNFRQTVVRDYCRTLRLARPAINVAARLLGHPRLPALGSALAHAFVSPLAFAEGSEGKLPAFVEAFFPVARKLGIEFLTLALGGNDPRLAAARGRLSSRTWRSVLYRVVWPGRAALPTPSAGASFLPEISFL